MTVNSNELHQLVIRNLAILEAAPKVVKEIQITVFTAINSRIREWYEKRNWDGVADCCVAKEDETIFHPRVWPKDEDGNYKAWYTFEATGYDNYAHYLSALTGIATSGDAFPYEFGLWFVVDAKAITGQANKAWKDYLAEQVNLHPELEQAGFRIFSGNKCSLYRPVRIDSELLAQSYPDAGDALSPVDLALQSLEDVHPIIDKILKNALQ